MIKFIKLIKKKSKSEEFEQLTLRTWRLISDHTSQYNPWCIWPVTAILMTLAYISIGLISAIGSFNERFGLFGYEND